MITNRNAEGVEAEPFLTCILLIKGKWIINFLGVFSIGYFMVESGLGTVSLSSKTVLMK